MENQNINLDEMRNQIAILRQKLDRQEIVSDRLLRDTMRTRMSDINRTKRFIIRCCLLCFVLFPLNVYMGTFGWPFALASCAMILFCLMKTYFIHRPVEDINLMNEDLATVARVMARFKQQYDTWLHYYTPALLIPWITWACYEFAWKNAPEGINPWWLCMPLFVGCAIGGIIGYRFHRNAVNAAEGILQQLEEA